ncbi:hypothetical protein EV702DRAFT_950460, partial [Suillus placidus]
LIKQFDLPKVKEGSTDTELLDMAGDVSNEDKVTIAENGNGDSDAEDVDDEDGWVDEINKLTPHERTALEMNMCPIRLMLVKLHKLAFKIVHSTTLLLPAWKDATEELGLGSRIMPHDVSTHWNSTFDMLEFAINYRKAIDAMTDKHKLGLGEYEMDDHEWMLVGQLQDTLEV